MEVLTKKIEAPRPCLPAGPEPSMVQGGQASRQGGTRHVLVIRQLKIDRVTGTDPFCFKPEVKVTKKGSEDKAKNQTPSLSPKPERYPDNE